MRSIVALALGAALATSAVAEPASFHGSAFSKPEGVVGLGLTVPFGGSRKKDLPRLELRVARDVVNMDGSRQSISMMRPIETRIGFSLESEKRLLINGRPVDRERRNNVSTGGWIAIGVGVALIAGVLLVADAARDASE